MLQLLTHLVEHKLAVSRRRCTEACDGKTVEDFKRSLAVEGTSVVVDEEGAAAVPGSEEGPGTFVHG